MGRGLTGDTSLARPCRRSRQEARAAPPRGHIIAERAAAVPRERSSPRPTSSRSRTRLAPSPCARSQLLRAPSALPTFLIWVMGTAQKAGKTTTAAVVSLPLTPSLGPSSRRAAMLVCATQMLSLRTDDTPRWIQEREDAPSSGRVRVLSRARDAARGPRCAAHLSRSATGPTTREPRADWRASDTHRAPRQGRPLLRSKRPISPSLSFYFGGHC